MKRLHISHSELLSGQSGEIYYYHSNKKDRSSALDNRESSKVEIRIPRSLGAVALEIALFDEKREKLIRAFSIGLSYTERDIDVYTITLAPHSLSVGLYFYKITVNTLLGDVFAVGGAESLHFSESECGFLQLSISEFEYERADDLLGGVIYHLFVDRFSKDSAVAPKSGARLIEDWSVIPEYPEYPGAFMRNNTFFGGTLNSAARRLDYIKSLGVNIIYLSPIFESPSNHKYDTADYMKVDSMFGGDEALVRFIKKAKKLGISVVLDGVFNHTGADSVYFNRYGTYSSLGAYESRESPYYGWYNFKSYPDDYEAWWGIEILPRINTGNESFERFILDEVIKKYRGLGIRGLRLDVADELSDDFIRKIKTALSEDGTSILYGEVWEDASNKIAYGKRKSYYLGGELDGVMNYPLRTGLIDFFRNKETDKLRFALTDIINNAPKRIRDFQMNILGTHDTERILTALCGDTASGKSNAELSVLRMTESERTLAEKKLMSAYTVLATLPGIPAIFYGDEAGLEGYSDPFNRMPYPKVVNLKILNHYKKMGQIRKDHSVYRDGDYELITLTGDLLIFARYAGAYRYVTLCNNSDSAVAVEFASPAVELISGNKEKYHIVSENSSIVFRTRDEFFLRKDQE